MNVLEINEVMGKNLYRIRKVRGLTQKTLGSKVGVGAATIGNYERGIRYIPGYLIHGLALALNVPEQFLVSELPDDIKNSDIANSNSNELLRKISDRDAWKKAELRKQVQTIQLVDNLLRDEYLELMLEEETDSEPLKKVKEKIFKIFHELEFCGDISQDFKNYEDNFDLLYWTGLFFFNFIVGQREIVKDNPYFKNINFIEEITDVLTQRSYSGELIYYKYEKEKTSE